MPVIIHHDKETFSEADLKKIGAYAYSRHSSTDCLLTSGLVDWGKGDRETKVRRWRPGDPFPYDDVHPDDIEIHAWNSQFERLIWREIMVPVYGWPALELEQFVCVSAQARICAAGPAKLDIAGRFFDRRHQKDNRGHLHMLKMCRPATEKEQERAVEHDAWTWEEAKRAHHTRPNIDRLHDYCDQDVLTEVDVEDMLPAWEQDDLDAFHQNERINDHGIVVDVDFADAASGYAEDEKAYFKQRIIELTDGEVTTPRQFQKIQKWALPLMSPEAKAICKWYDNGVEKYSFDADTRANLLSEASADLDWIAREPEDAEDLVDFIELLDAAGKSTVSKYQAIADRAVKGLTDDNWRVHGAYVFAGASQSGRYSSTGIQMHNLVRDVPKNTLELIRAFKRADEDAIWDEVEAWAATKNAGVAETKKKAASDGLEEAEVGIYAEDKRYKDADGKGGRFKGGRGVGANPGRGLRATPAEPVHALGTLVRPTIRGCPKGSFDLVWCDWSSIEACVLPWLSLDPDADDRLAALRRGEDIYLKTASAILKRKVTKEDANDRQAFGKVPELSLGYLGGKGAFKAMAKNYGVRLPDDQIAGIVKTWRAENPWAMAFGKACEQAAMNAIRRPGVSYSAGRLEYRYSPTALDGIGALWCKLPSDRELCYPGARIQIVTTAWGEEKHGITAMKSAWHPKKGEPWENWPRVSLWPGLLIENATQAVATADMLHLCLRRVEKAGLMICAHTHDEIMIETAKPERDAVVLHRLMTKCPPWRGAELLPLRAEVEYGYRYKVKVKVEEKRMAA
jgi:DNA polymerase bacteriophage-type